MSQDEPVEETYSPWTVVHLVFGHLAEHGLHPTLGDSGDPGESAAALLRALGIAPAAGTGRPMPQHVREELAELRATLLDAP